MAETLRLAVDGTSAGLLHRAGEKEDVPIVLRLPRAERSKLDSLKAVRVMGRQGNLVPLGELVRIEPETAEKSIYHKNLMPVVYVTADVAGKVESPVYAILSIDKELDKLALPGGTSSSGTWRPSRRPTGRSR